jgi:glycosyltransferase involved in cell wall biosynthesis
MGIMRIVALIHFAVPYRMAGSETMLHWMMKSLVDRGHDVHAVVSDMPEAPPEWEQDGIRYHSRPGLAAASTRAGALRPDVIVTHHQNATRGIMLAKQRGIPSVFVQHNTFGMNTQILATKPDLTVFNTHWMAQTWRHKAVNWMVVHPPVWPADHATTPGDHITLINLNRHKGVETFQRLARAMPDTPFLGVTGGHGEQVTWNMTPNVTVIPQTFHMRSEVWSRTKILLVPSAYESYGMVYVEACASGIPVIAAPTPGLQEALGHAGIFARRDQIAEWVAQVRRLINDPGHYANVSAACRQRSVELSPEVELGQWAGAVEALQSQHGAHARAVIA